MISSFEYVTVLISIVLGLGITQILTGVAKLIQKRERIIFYWPHLIWIAFVLFLHVQEWWVMYELKTFVPWRLPVFLFIMLYPVNLFVMAKVILPDHWRSKRIDLSQFYFQNFEKFFALLIVAAALSFFYNIFILNLRIMDQALQVLIIFVFSYLVQRRSMNDRLHKGISLAIFVVASLAVVVEWNQWLVN